MRSTKPLLTKKIESFQPIEVPTLERKPPSEIHIPKPKKEAQ
jgi:hypothetical protein